MRIERIGKIKGREAPKLKSIQITPQPIHANNNQPTTTRAATAPAEGQNNVQQITVQTATFTDEHSSTQDIPSRIPIRQLAEGIARQEGFYNPKGSVAQRNNSPCNLTNKGDLGKAGRFAKFSTVEKGFQSCEKSLQRYIDQGKTLTQLMHIWSPKGDGDNNPSLAAQNVSKFAGIDKNVKLNLIIK